MQDKTILVVDDDETLQLLVTHALEKIGIQVYTAQNGKEALRRLYDIRPDLVILDVMMPGMDGWQLCAQIRNLTDVPIIMLTSLGSEDHVVQGFDCGAVDYVIKPFSHKILRARVQAALRQADKSSFQKKTTTYADAYLSIDLDNRRVMIQGDPVKLSATEYKLLAHLVENAGRVLTFEQILETVWGWEYRESVDYVHVYISHLRRKLEEDPKEPHYLISEHGVGYRFERQNLD